MSQPMVMEYLSRIELLRGLAPKDLETLLDSSSERELAAGDWLIHEGDVGDEMYVVLDGLLEVSVREGAVEEQVAKRSQGDVVGELALLGRTTRTASVRATTTSHVLVVSQAAFETLLTCPGAATTIYRTSLEREHYLASLLARREKLAALGTMAAGLAHELNNPAAALRRSAKELGPAMERRDKHAAALFGKELHGEELAGALELRAIARDHFSGSPLAAARADPQVEEELQQALEDLGVHDPWEAAAGLYDAGWSATEMGAALAPFEATTKPAAADWLAADAACRVLLREISLSSQAVSDLVGAVKEYTQLDRAPIADVNVQASLENTLLILKHRLKDGGVTVLRDYRDDLPQIEAYASELSQVWTNLIDNAVDAMGGSGVLRLSTSADDAQVTVEVSDDGPGIAETDKSHLFEPFYSTKGVGDGTGLGLYITKEIVMQRHGGSLSFTSEPGSTTFRVTLPLRMGARGQ
ncbi:MAG TPA: ATP-binding protein [Trueperaceae bacterium]|nr:ATP-binding protein [Trueperaceae bacterium]